IFRLGNAAGPGNLDGHRPIQLRVARLVNGAEGAHAELFEELELAQPTGRLGGQPGARRAGIELDAGAAAGADDRFGRRVAKWKGTVATRTLNRHGGEVQDRTRASVAPGSVALAR